MYTNQFVALDIIVDSESDNLCDIGLIDDVIEQSRGLQQKLKIAYRTPEAPNTLRTVGHYFSAKNIAAVDHYIAYERLEDPADSYFVQAHEETHALHNMGQIHVLEDRLRERGIDFDLRKFNDYGNCTKSGREYVAHIGALYALDKENVDLNAWAKNNAPLDSTYQLKSAFEDYMKARAPYAAPQQYKQPSPAPIRQADTGSLDNVFDKYFRPLNEARQQLRARASGYPQPTHPAFAQFAA